MINYIFLFFLPGSAGNFFSRCLALASDRCYGWIGAQVPKLHLDLEEKFRLYQYSDPIEDDWISFERRLSHYSKHYPHHELPQGSYSIWAHHPNTQQTVRHNLAGPNDRQHVFYIDPSENFQWCMLNSLYKNSVIDVKWMIEGKKMLDDPNIIKINLSDIIASGDSLVRTVQQVCESVGLCLQEENRAKIQDLWNQWILTSLCPQRFQDFKKEIGYFDT